MPVLPNRIASPQFLLLWSSSFTVYTAFELGIATGAGGTLTVTRWKR